MHIFCIEQNYFANKDDQKVESNREPVIFSKSSTALLQEDVSFSYPGFSNELYCSCELVLRICKTGTNVPVNEAADFYDAISVGINFIAFDNEEQMPEDEFWQKTKGWNNSSAVGKWMPVKDFDNKSSIDFCLYKNREMAQFCNSGLMIKNFESLINIISQSNTLREGDLIFTGTQVNIGELLVGDLLEAFIEDDSLLEMEIE